MEEIIARGIQALLALSGAYLLALWFVLVVWTFRDIETRSRSVITQIFSTLLVVLFYVPGVLLYMILRPKETLDGTFQRSLEEEYLLQDLEELPLCQSCQRYVEDDFILCPHCHTTLREPCASCDRLVHLRWSLCPYCGAEQSKKAAVAHERVEIPAARWQSPASPRRRTTPAIVARPVVVPPRPEPQIPIGADLTVPSSTEIAAPALTVVKENANNMAPVRLFDRRKTRAAQRNGSDRALVGVGASGSHTNGNGTRLGDDQRLPYIVGNPMSENGHSPNVNEERTAAPDTRTKVGAHSPADGE